MNPQVCYRRIKWLWLLSRCALPTLAMYYLLSVPFPGDTFDHLIPWLPDSAAAFLLTVSGMFYLVVWLIAESLLSMYKFPLNLREAIFLVTGFVIQMVVLTFTGESLSFAAYVSIYVTLAALFVCTVWLAALFIISPRPQGSRQPLRRSLINAGVVFISLLIAGLFLAFLFPPLWTGFDEMRGLYQALNAGILLVNVTGTVRLLRGFSIWGDPDPEKDCYDAEWQKWAAPTIILLILAAVTAVMTGGIMHAN